MKKGVLTTETFMYIFAIIVIALILVFGARTIYNFDKTKQQAIYIQFKTDFINAVENVYTKNVGTTIVYSVGSSNSPLQVPSSTQNICFDEPEGDLKVRLDPPKYSFFSVEHLRTSNTFGDCIQIKNQKFSFKLINELENNEIVVKIHKIT